MFLIIVESPNKVKTINKYLNSMSDEQVKEIFGCEKSKNLFKVMATVGHIKDLAMDGKYNLGVDIDSGKFEPEFAILSDKHNVVNKLLKASKEAEKIFIATDPDREGEAIALHVAEEFNIKPEEVNRLEFHEITRHAIIDSFKNVRHINMNTYYAQETRRIMDRIIGFRLSYLVQKQVGCNSAGRVQSAVLKFVYDNYNERNDFKSESYYNVLVKLKDNSNKTFEANLVDSEGKIVNFFSKDELDKTLENLGTFFELENIENETISHSSFAPYTMSGIIQAASALKHYQTSVTTKALKELFESGYITYPRTDSIRLAPEFINRTKKLIKEKFGEEYVGVAKVQGLKNNVADAHEALRPTDLEMTPEKISEELKGVAPRFIYKLIYDQTIKSIMTPNIELVKSYIFDLGKYKLVYKTTKTESLGYKKYDNEELKEFNLLDFNKNNKAKLVKIEKEEKKTKPAPLFTEGTLVKKMEETGIGRPSTYNQVIQTLLKSNYIELINHNINITNDGINLSKYLENHFPNTINTEYTADLENKLDLIEQGLQTRDDTLNLCNNNFLKEFEPSLAEPVEKDPTLLDELCPVCGNPLKHIKRGKLDFIGCSNYPSCKYVKPEYVGRVCPNCGKQLVYKAGKIGRFIACEGYPSCKYVEFPKKSFKKYVK